MSGLGRGVENGRPNEVARGLERRDAPERTSTGDTQLTPIPLPPRQQVEPRESVLDRVMRRAEAMAANPAGHQSVITQLEAWLTALGIPQATRLNSTQGDLIGRLARVLRRRSNALHILRQLAASNDQMPELDVPFVVMIAMRESRMNQRHLLGRDRQPNVHTYGGGGLDNLGAALRAGARALIPPRYATPAWLEAREQQAFEGPSRVHPAVVPSGALWVAYAVFLEHTRQRVLPGYHLGDLTELQRRYFHGLAFGGPYGRDHESYTRAMERVRRLERAGTEVPPHEMPAFGLNTVVTWLRARPGSRTIGQLMADTAVIRDLSAAWGHKQRYRRPWYVAVEATVIEAYQLIPRRIRYADLPPR